MHTVNKRLIYEVIHLQRQPSILYINCAKSYYGSILYSVASMEMQRLDMSLHPMKCMLGTL